jgi:hypothetical protein
MSLVMEAIKRLSTAWWCKVKIENYRLNRHCKLPIFFINWFVTIFFFKKNVTFFFYEDWKKDYKKSKLRKMGMLFKP